MTAISSRLGTSMLALAFVLVTSAGSSGHEGAVMGHQGAVMPKPMLERHAVMTSLAAHSVAIKTAIARRDSEAVARHAEAMHWLAQIVPHSFPNGSGEALGKTRALPKIWQDWTGFTAAAHALAEEAAKLAAAAKSGQTQQLHVRFATMAKRGCGGCHGTYRAPKR